MSTETLLRKHLEAEARDVELIPASPDRIVRKVRRSRVWLGVAAVLGLVVFIGGLGMLNRDPVQLTAQPPATTDGAVDSAVTTDGVFDLAITDLLPPGFDPWNAVTLATQVGTPEYAATAYLASRLPQKDSLGVAIVEVIVEEHGFSAVRWAASGALDGTWDGSESYLAGWVLLRDRAGTQEVIAATTDLIDLSDLRVVDGKVIGTIRSQQIDAVALDLLTLDMEVVPSAPNPDGLFPEGDLFGSSGFSEGPAALGDDVLLPVAVAVPPGQIVARVQLVGGTLLSVSEIVIGPSPLDRAMEVLLRDAVPADVEGSMMIAAFGPEPEFTPPGEDQPLEPSLGWEDIDLTLMPDPADGPHRLDPVVYIGRVAGHALIGFEAITAAPGTEPDQLQGVRSYCTYMFELAVGGYSGSCGTPASMGIERRFSSGPGDGSGYWLFVFDALDAEASVAVLETDSATLWQRPVGGVAAFGLDVLEGELVTMTIYDAKGREIQSERFTPGS